SDWIKEKITEHPLCPVDLADAITASRSSMLCCCLHRTYHSGYHRTDSSMRRCRTSSSDNYTALRCCHTSNSDSSMRRCRTSSSDNYTEHRCPQHSTDCHSGRMHNSLH